MARPLVFRLMLAATGLFALASFARADSITIDPPTPNPADSVGVVFHGEFSMACWTVDSKTCLFVAPDSVIVQAVIQYCGGAPSCFCGIVPTPYQVACDFPPLPVGTYKAVYREIKLNPSDQRDPVTMTREFTVSGPTGIERRSWGRVKAYYR